LKIVCTVLRQTNAVAAIVVEVETTWALLSTTFAIASCLVVLITDWADARIVMSAFTRTRV
jgi:hypothetical protein